MIDRARRSAPGNSGGRHPARWTEVRPEGLFVRPGGFFVDPLRPVERAIVTHGHADHARPGHDRVLATTETLAVMRARLGQGAGRRQQAAAYGETIEVGETRVTLLPAGHVLGSAQVLIEHEGARLVCSGDYKDVADPTCAAFAPVPCDVFVTEATFALPVFRHPEPAGEIAKLLDSRHLFTGRCHVVGAYALGKAQRLIAELRRAGYDRPIWLHGALMPLCALYEAHGVRLGDLRPATIDVAAGGRGRVRAELAGEIVLAPPSAIADRWARRLPDPLVAMASGWMRVKQRARQRGVELPLVLSDHADWDGLIASCVATGAQEVWITHGREEALARALEVRGIEARALAMVGYEEEDA